MNFKINNRIKFAILVGNFATSIVFSLCYLSWATIFAPHSSETPFFSFSLYFSVSFTDAPSRSRRCLEEQGAILAATAQGPFPCRRRPPLAPPPQPPHLYPLRRWLLLLHHSTLAQPISWFPQRLVAVVHLFLSQTRYSINYRFCH